MAKRDGRAGFPITRRRFLGTSAAAIGAAAVASAQNELPPSLHVYTEYSPQADGGERLAAVELRLGDKKDSRIILRGTDFVPQGSVAPTVRLAGLTGLFRDPSIPIDDRTTLTIRIIGVDLFNHATGMVGGRCTYTFTVKADVRVVGKDRHATWQIRLNSNVWVHKTLRYSLDFPVVELGQAGSVTLADVVDGRAGFRLNIGPGWVTETLSRIVGQAVAATGDHVVDFGPVPLADKASDEPRIWNWTVWPRHPNSGLSLYNGAIQFRSLRFGWQHQAPEQAGIGDGSRFAIQQGDGTATTTAEASTPSRNADLNGLARLPRSRFAIRGEATSALWLAGPDVAAVWTTNSKVAPDEVKVAPGAVKTERVAEVSLSGKVSVGVVSGGTELTNVTYKFGPSTSNDQSSLALRKLPSIKNWLLTADFRPDSLATLNMQDPLGARVVSDDGKPGQAGDTAAFSTLFGWLPLRQRPAGQPEDDRLGLAATLHPGRVATFAMRAGLSDLPASLASGDAQRLYSRLRVVDAGFAPVLRLSGVELAGLTEAQAQRFGHLFLDGSLVAKDVKATLDLPMDQVRIEVRRAADMMLLDFRLANLRLVSTAVPGGFVLAPDPVTATPDTFPVDYPKIPVLRADFPPLHMAEQAFLRRDGAAGGLPSLDFLTLAGMVKEGWPAKVADGFMTLRSGTRDQKRIARRTIFRVFADRLRDILEKPEEPQNKQPAEDLLKEDARLRDRVTDFRDFAELYDKWAKRGLFGKAPSLPEDQRVYIGADDLDPDAACLAWMLRNDDLLVIRRTRLLERIGTVDGSLEKDRVEPDPRVSDLAQADKASRLYRLSQVILPKGSQPIANITRFELRAADDPVLNAIKAYTKPGFTKAEMAEIQRKASALKEKLAPDYAEFRERWSLAAEGYRASLSEDDFREVSDFASLAWALDKPPDDKVAELLQRVVEHMVDLTGDADEPFPVRSRARLSGPTRLAFAFDRRTGDAEQTRERPFALNELLTWNERDQIVTLRAQALRKVGPDGQLARTVDMGEFLKLQGFVPQPDLTSAEWMAMVYAAAARPPKDYETAIELPFRLQLSPAQDPVWIQPHDVKLGRTFFAVMADDGTKTPKAPPPADFGTEPGRPLWSVALEPRNPDPQLRAIWSEDFWPERFLSYRETPDPPVDLDPRDLAGLAKVAARFDPPPRGPGAPWHEPRLRRRDSDIIDSTAIDVTLREPAFRASMDPYDRDQIITESGVHGIPVKRGIDPTTKEVIENGDSYSAPAGFEALDMAFEVVRDEQDNETARIGSSAIYAARALTFRELRLTAMGGTLDLQTGFKPPVAASLLDRRSLFPSLTLESWRHLAVLGRDRAVELVYKGYLFPFGHHASLVKLTERRYTTPTKGRGPTAYLVQRFFIRCSEPVKRAWYDQPDSGRAWPVEELRILTEQTPDLVDPLPGAARHAGSLSDPQIDPVTGVGKVGTNGRISLVGGRGLVFWPRTAPFEGAEVPFEFQIDAVSQAHRMPLIFVDNEAANHEPTLAALVTYYNAQEPGAGKGSDARFLDSRLDRKNKRVFDQGGAPRRYAPPVEEGDTSYETLAWLIGVEGRRGAAARDAAPADALTKARATALGDRSNFGFSPLLLSSDQPPFYPLVQLAELRLDRLGRLLGERKGRVCLAAFECGYLKGGFVEVAPYQGPKAFLGILSRFDVNVGDRGDRVGAIGRMAGRLLGCALKEGPVTTGGDKSLQETAYDAETYITMPPDFGSALRVALKQIAPSTPAAAPTTNAVATAEPPAPPADPLKDLIEKLLGDHKLFSYKITELIDTKVLTEELLSLAGDVAPKITELREYAEGAAEGLVKLVRDQVVPALRKALKDVREAFDSAAVGAFGRKLELSKVYPEIGAAMAALDRALLAFESERDPIEAARKLTGIATGGKALLKAFEKVARDPVSPLKMELQRIFLSDLEGIEAIEKLLRELVKSPPDFGAEIKTAEALLVSELLLWLNDLGNEKSVVDAVKRWMPLPELGTTVPSGVRTAIKAVVDEVVRGTWKEIVKGISKGAGSGPVPSTFQGVLTNLQAFNGRDALVAALIASQTLTAIRADIEDQLKGLDARAQRYWAQVCGIIDEIERIKAAITAARADLDAAVEAAVEGLETLADEERAKAEADVAKLKAEVALEKIRLEELARKEIGNLANKASRALFGVDGLTLLTRANALVGAINKIGQTPDFGPKIMAVLDLLRLIDAFFLQGRFRHAAKTRFDALAEDLTPVLKVMLDGYAAVLDLADSFAAASEDLVKDADPLAKVGIVKKAMTDLAATSELVADLRNLAKGGGDIEADARVLLDKLTKALTAAPKALGIDENKTPGLATQAFARLKTLVLDLAEALKTAAVDAAKIADGGTRDLALQALKLYEETFWRMHQAMLGAAMAVAKVATARTDWDNVSAPARAAILIAEANPTVPAINALIDTFPRDGLVALLEAWPAAASQAFHAAEDLALVCEDSKDIFDEVGKKLAGAGAQAEQIVQQALRDGEAAIAKFADGLFNDAKDRAEKIGEDTAQALSDAANISSKRASAIKRLQSIQRDVALFIADNSFLAPFATIAEKMLVELTQIPETLPITKALNDSKAAVEEIDKASGIEKTFEAVRNLRKTLEQIDVNPSLGVLRKAAFAIGEDAGGQVREELLGQAATAIAALSDVVDDVVDQAEAYLLDMLFSNPKVQGALGMLSKTANALVSQRNGILTRLNLKKTAEKGTLADQIGTIMAFFKLGPAVEEPADRPRFLFVGLPQSGLGPAQQWDAKRKLLEAAPDNPKDQLWREADALAQLATQGNLPKKLAAFRTFLGAGAGKDLAVVQIVDEVSALLEQLLRVDLAALVDFKQVRKLVEDELRKLLPTRITTRMDYSVPLGAFPDGDAAIFKPVGNGRFSVVSINTVDFADPSNPKLTARAEALLSPFDIKLLGNFDALTLSFSAARLSWTLGEQPHFSIDFIGYKIGEQLAFVQELASALGDSAGGAFIRPAQGFPGIEAGYRINIPAFTLGAVTFLNVGLSASALLPFDSRPALFAAALSSRDDPFVIIAGIWGGGGHFQLVSDGKRITGFDASFVFGGGGGVSYGPLQMVGRITVGVFIRKVGHYTEIAGDFFAGGSGRVGIFGISASLTVTTGMTGDGQMYGSAVFRFSFSVSFAKITFAVTVFKKEAKGFSGQQQAMLDRRSPYRIAQTTGALPSPPPKPTRARIRVNVVRQDQDYARWQGYFSELRPEGY